MVPLFLLLLLLFKKTNSDTKWWCNDSLETPLPDSQLIYYDGVCCYDRVASWVGSRDFINKQKTTCSVTCLQTMAPCNLLAKLWLPGQQWRGPVDGEDEGEYGRMKEVECGSGCSSSSSISSSSSNGSGKDSNQKTGCDQKIGCDEKAACNEKVGCGSPEANNNSSDRGDGARKNMGDCDSKKPVDVMKVSV